MLLCVQMLITLYVPFLMQIKYLWPVYLWTPEYIRLLSLLSHIFTKPDYNIDILPGSNIAYPVSKVKRKRVTFWRLTIRQPFGHFS